MPRTLKVLEYKKPSHTEVSTFCCLILIGDDILPDDTPLELADGRKAPPGSAFTRLGGKKTSAGFEDLTFTDPFIYYGHWTGSGERYALFRQAGRPGPGKWFAFYDSGEELIFHTPARAGRVIETTRCVYLEPSS